MACNEFQPMTMTTCWKIESSFRKFLRIFDKVHENSWKSFHDYRHWFKLTTGHGVIITNKLNFLFFVWQLVPLTNLCQPKVVIVFCLAAHSSAAHTIILVGDFFSGGMCTSIGRNFRLWRHQDKKSLRFLFRLASFTFHKNRRKLSVAHSHTNKLP